MSKGTNTTASVPDWAKPYALKAMQNVGNVEDYFWGGLQDWRNGGSGTKLGGDNGGNRTYPLGPGRQTQDARSTGLTATTEPVGGGGGGDSSTTLPGIVGAGVGTGTVRRRLTAGPTGDTPPADTVGAPGYYYDPSILLGYNPQDVPDLSSAQQEWGSLIPQLFNQPADEQTAKDWATANLTESGRVPTLSVGDVLGSPAAAAGGGVGASATGMSATTLPATPGTATSTSAVGDWISDPTIRAAKEIFDTTGAEQIKNATTQAGLGRSTAVGDALAKGWAAQLMPLIGQQLDYQNQAINREQAARNTGISTNLETGGRDTSRLLAGLGQLQTFGGTQRDLAQQQSDAKEKERMRLQALGESSLFPYGSNITALGSSTRKA